MQLPTRNKLSTHLRVLMILVRVTGVGSLLTASVALLSFVMQSDRSFVLLAIAMGCAIFGVLLLVVRSPDPEDVERMFGKRKD